MTEYIIKAEIVATRLSTYSTYVFKNKESPFNFIICTRLPNWQIPEIFIGDEGFLQYNIVSAGDIFLTPEGDTVTYKYDNCYLINFIQKTDITKEQHLIL